MSHGGWRLKVPTCNEKAVVGQGRRIGAAAEGLAHHCRHSPNSLGRYDEDHPLRVILLQLLPLALFLQHDNGFLHPLLALSGTAVRNDKDFEFADARSEVHQGNMQAGTRYC